MLLSYIHRLLLILLPILALCMFNLGMDWIEKGYGVHPLISFSLMSLFILFTFILYIKPIPSRYTSIYHDDFL